MELDSRASKRPANNELSKYLSSCEVTILSWVFRGESGFWESRVRLPRRPTASPALSPVPPPDPRLTYQTEFRNVHPDLKYVGDAVCAKCHADIDHSYHQHPMGRSAARIGQESPLEKYGPAASNPFQTPAHTLTVLKDGDRVRHRVTGVATDAPTYETAVDIVLGSGTRGRSYLTVDRGSVWQTGISWFTDDGRWNVSPGFDLGLGGRRAIVADCLFCHVDRTDPVPGSTNLYKQVVIGQAHIGCERCHGPGELHVRTQTDTPTDTRRDPTIVNPKHLSAELQMDVCRQCHLQAEQRVNRRGRDLFEYRPGLPLDLFQSVYVRHPDLADTRRSVGQFEQMERSACFTTSANSDRAMTCTTCHDPHRASAKAEVAAFYRSKCLTCHDKKGCSQPEPVRQAKADSCIACHMPRAESTSIAHAAVTDHRIPRKPTPPPATKPNPSALPRGELPIMPYRTGSGAVSPDELDRDLAVALALQVPKLAPATAQAVATTAAAKLEAAVARWPDDAVAWLRLSGMYAGLKNLPGEVEAARKAVELQPESEAALTALAAAEAKAKAFPAALAAVDRLIHINPAAVEHRQLRASICLESKDWIAADAACGDAIAINPISAEAYILKAMALDGLGKRADARKAANTAFALETNPERQKLFRQSFRPQW
jgi:tetratricopeptide (TPR) repeat protein